MNNLILGTIIDCVVIIFVFLLRSSNKESSATVPASIATSDIFMGAGHIALV
jgi:hypothetical protein